MMVCLLRVEHNPIWYFSVQADIKEWSAGYIADAKEKSFYRNLTNTILDLQHNLQHSDDEGFFVEKEDGGLLFEDDDERAEVWIKTDRIPLILLANEGVTYE